MDCCCDNYLKDEELWLGRCEDKVYWLCSRREVCLWKGIGREGRSPPARPRVPEVRGVASDPATATSARSGVSGKLTIRMAA